MYMYLAKTKPLSASTHVMTSLLAGAARHQANAERDTAGLLQVCVAQPDTEHWRHQRHCHSDRRRDSTRSAPGEQAPRLLCEAMNVGQCELISAVARGS